MARIREFYKGRKKRRNYALIPFIILLGLIVLLLVVFYGLQQYAVITDAGVEVQLPLLEGEDQTAVDSQGNEVKVFPRVETELIFDQPDYSRIQATAGRYMTGIKAIFVPAADITSEKMPEYTQRLNRGNALVLEMKPRDGTLLWASQSDAARGYGLSATAEQDAAVREVIEYIQSYEEKDVYLAAQISCCIDALYPSRSTSVALRTEGGLNYTDEKGTWLDPYNADVRHYAAQLARELFDMGFDEVILADVEHPVPPAPQEGQEAVRFMYSREMSTTPSPVTAVCGFAVSVANELADREGVLSIYVNKAEALVKANEQNGQDAVLFLKLFDRVYYPTDTYTYTNYNVADVEPNVSIGDVHVRFVPVLTNYLFTESNDNASWVLIDQPAEPEE